MKQHIGQIVRPSKQLDILSNQYSKSWTKQTKLGYCLSNCVSLNMIGADPPSSTDHIFWRTELKTPPETPQRHPRVTSETPQNHLRDTLETT